MTVQDWLRATGSTLDALPGVRVRTIDNLEGTEGYMVTQRALDARRPAELGILETWIPGHGGDAWWIRHEEGDVESNPRCVAAYVLTEVEFVDAPPEPTLPRPRS